MDFKHKTANRLNELVAVVLMIGILAMMNLIGSRKFVRIDLTERGEYTITQATKNILGKLDDVITIKAYFSGNIPPMQQAMLQQVRDILAEYQVYARGKLKVEYIDPSGDDELKQSLQMLNIPEVRLNTFEKDKQQVIACYMGLGVFYEDRKAVIPVVLQLGNFEYDLTASIRKVAMKKPPVVGILQDYGMLDLNKELTNLKNSLEQQYDLRPVKMTKERGVGEEIDTLVIPGPKEKLPAWALYHIDQYLVKGGHVIALTEAFKLGEGLNAQRNQTGLDEVLAHHGVTVEPALVVDQQCSHATFNQGYMSFTMPYAFFPKAAGPGLNKDMPVTSPLESITFPWISPLTVSPDTKEVRTLASSSERSWVQKGHIQLNPNNQVTPPAQSEIKPSTLAVMLSGSFISKYSETGMPSDEDSSDATLKTADETTKTGPETHLMVVGDSDFISDQHVRSDRGNLVFLLNAIDWMTLDPELINIRSRIVVDYPLVKLQEWEEAAGDKGGAVVESRKNMIKYASSFGVPFIIVILGVLWHFLRRMWITSAAAKIMADGGAR